ncbi:hypothetical protein [Burkholderia sp. Ac-20365]|uniref:hypothetical protein n=1 Tax=Burkholderia sp. Ac-20365 TaxID=2703897 RepID=UPI00197BCBF1|nr:hypothetical protein [Burkholderia sp. Ac-20365]MBN3760891.1 hypothetical protein [Burkholderia sp. Ac-20365]
MKMRLFHLSTSECPRGRFHPLAHFGTLETAVRLARLPANKDQPRTLYEIELESPVGFLIVPDLARALHGTTHQASPIAQILGTPAGGCPRLYTKGELDRVVALAVDYGPNRAARQLIDLLEAKGYSALTYRNGRDTAADDWVLFDQSTLRVVHSYRWHAQAASDGTRDGVTAFDQWETPLTAIINARPFFAGLRGGMWANDVRRAHRFQDVIEGLDESQRSLAASLIVSAALLRRRIEDALALVDEAVGQYGVDDGQATLAGSDLREALRALDANTSSSAVPLPVRMPFLPSEMSLHKLAA